ncbi:MAG: hypothetical protein Q8J78_00050 [Moraxellaceae bacterium]|nr:hypothetical protein [Moraxellaceae bacterium]
MFDTYLASSELVFFWDGESIDKSMMFSDFEATLDGYVGLQAYAAEEKRAAYVQLDDQLQVRAVVLFSIAFDDAGFADRSWNLPLRHMAEIAGRGPDLGAGPIHLVCRSQCSISWHAPRLWDPEMRPERSTFVQIQKETELACARFSLRPQRPVVTASQAMPLSASYAPAADEDIPTLTDAAPMVQAAAAGWELEREKLLARLGEQQLRITTIENDKNETIARLGFLHQQQVDILEAQNGKLIGQFKAMKAQSDTQRDQIETLRQQIGSVARIEEGLAEERRLHEEQLSALMQTRVGEETQKFRELLAQKEHEFAMREARLHSEFQLSLEQRLGEEVSSHQLQLESLRAEISYREETLATLGRELAEIKASVAQREQMAADEFLRHLESLGMNFVAFHPGAGHLSVPVSELAVYVENPVGFAAAKCLVSEEQYRAWLAHYESPRCTAPLGDSKCCDARLIRTDSPTRFRPGQSDRCARHQAADSAIDNVLRFR